MDCAPSEAYRPVFLHLALMTRTSNPVPVENSHGQTGHINSLYLRIFMQLSSSFCTVSHHWLKYTDIQCRGRQGSCGSPLYFKDLFSCFENISYWYTVENWVQQNKDAPGPNLLILKTLLPFSPYIHFSRINILSPLSTLFGTFIESLAFYACSESVSSTLTIFGALICLITPHFSYTKIPVQILFICGRNSKWSILFEINIKMDGWQETHLLDFATKINF